MQPALRWTGSGDCEACEREGERRERFILRLLYAGRTERCEVEQGAWERTAVGDSFEVGAAGASFDCSFIAAQ